MKGAIADPCANTNIKTIKIKTTIIGISHQRLRFHRKASNSPMIPKRESRLLRGCSLMQSSNSEAHYSISWNALRGLRRAIILIRTYMENKAVLARQLCIHDHNEIFNCYSSAIMKTTSAGMPGLSESPGSSTDNSMA